MSTIEFLLENDFLLLGGFSWVVFIAYICMKLRERRAFHGN